MNSILGFSESFSANYYCRFCTTDKATATQQLKVDCLSLRKENEYRNHVQNKLYGIRENCVWNNLMNFHVYNNVSCDIMHDLFEGIHRYEMALIVANFVERDFFTLNYLNNRIQYFLYDNLDRNKPTEIKHNHIANKCIIMSAAEMLSLVVNFRFIIGDVVPHNDPVWQFYLKLLEITEILIADSITEPLSRFLENLIQEHHESYISIFNTHLKPKHHFMLHYREIINKIGPLSSTSSIRYEAKHKQLKDIAKNINNHINLPYTLASRLQLKVAHRMMSEVGTEDNVEIGKLYVLENLPAENYNFLDDLLVSQSLYTERYKINGIQYKINDIITIDYIDENPIFGVIINILINKDNSNCSFCYKKLRTKVFDLHFRAYEVELTNDKDHIKIEKLTTIIPTILHTIGRDKLYVSTSKLF